MRRCAALMVTWLFVGGACAEAQQETSAPSSVVRQSRDDAWWTGPMLAPSAATLPRGHFLIEPLSLRCDRSSFKRLRIAHVRALRTRR